MSEIARETVRAHSYGEASEQLEVFLRDTYSPSYIWEITNFVGFILINERDKRISKLRDLYKANFSKSEVFTLYKSGFQADKLYSLIDGSFLNTRPDDINVVLKNMSNWRECKAAMVFAPQDLVMRKPGKHGEERYSIKKSDYDAFIGKADDFKFIFLDLLLRNGLCEDTTVILLSDGADWIQRIAEEMLKPLGIKIIPINDLYHTKENIGKFCQYVNDQISKNAEGFQELNQLDADYIISLVENGKAEIAINELEPYRNISVKGLVNAYTYINDRKDRMNYPAYREAGYYVGSGPMESANKYYIQNRMKGPGMAWAIACGQRMLILRGYFIGDHWDDVDKILKNQRDNLIELKKQFEVSEQARITYKREMDNILELLLN